MGSTNFYLKHEFLNCATLLERVGRGERGVAASFKVVKVFEAKLTVMKKFESRFKGEVLELFHAETILECIYPFIPRRSFGVPPHKFLRRASERATEESGRVRSTLSRSGYCQIPWAHSSRGTASRRDDNLERAGLSAWWVKS